MSKLIVANWKMKLTVEEGLSLLKEASTFSDYKNDLVICPDFLILSQAKSILENTKIRLGAQNASISERGALTGEISAHDLKYLGVKYVIIGHSERRRIFKEGSSAINDKIQTALRVGLVPILCLGESLLERRSGRTRPVLSSQIKSSLKDIKVKRSGDLIIAYEPVWAIGSGKPMSHDEADKVQNYISDRALKLTGKRFRVLYGGSVAEDNAGKLLEQKHIDGLLVGGASLKADSLKSLLNA